tara:strand:- start:653 stop:1213 length:561 start_codon:yes stop_codon:yes gene_type:complete
MTSGSSKKTIREAVAVFYDGEQLKKTVNAVLEAGYTNDQIGLLASENSIKASLGDFYHRTNESQDAGQKPVTAFVGKKDGETEQGSFGGSLFFIGTTGAMGGVVASSAVLGGALVAALSGIFAVGLVGALAGKIIHQSDADYLQQQIDEGHILLFVRITDEDSEKKLSKLLESESGDKVRICEITV